MGAGGTAGRAEGAAGADPARARLLAPLERLLALEPAGLRPALAGAAQLVAEALGADKVDAFLHDPAIDSLVAVGTSDTPLGHRQRALGLDRLPLANGGRLVEAFRAGAPYRTGRADADSGELVGITRGLGIRSALAVPLAVGGERRGLLAAASATPERFTADDLRFLEAAARWVGAVAHRAELAELAERRAAAAAAARRRAEQAERLAATLARVGAAPDVAGALEALLRGAVALLGGAHGVARLFGPGPGERPLELILQGGPAAGPAAGEGRLTTRVAPPPLRPGTFAAALQAGGPPTVVADFWALDPAGYPAYATLRREGLRAAVNVPIEAAGRRLGSLHVNHPQPGAFGPAELALAGALALQAGAAVERARLEAAQREQLARLARQGEELDRRAAEAAALRELDRLKTELLATMAHELRTPLTVVHGYAEHLLEGARRGDAPAVERMAARVFAGSRQLVRLVQDLVDFARLGGGEVVVQPAPYDLVPQLAELVRGVRHQPGGERLVADLPAALPVYADRARVEQIVGNLVDNALKYAPAGPIRLRARPRRGARVRVEVADAGPGVPPREQARVWEKLYRGRGVAGLSAVRGTGIGLAVVKALVEAQGGCVGLRSAPGGGACFWFELPARAGLGG